MRPAIPYVMPKAVADVMMRNFKMFSGMLPVTCTPFAITGGSYTGL